MNNGVRFTYKGVPIVACLGADRVWRCTASAAVEAGLNAAFGPDALDSHDQPLYPTPADQLAAVAERLAGELVTIEEAPDDAQP